MNSTIKRKNAFDSFTYSIYLSSQDLSTRMASGSSNSFDIRALINKLKDKDFIQSILSHLNNALREMTKLGREKFQEYDEFVTKVDQFKTGLLDYVLDSLVHLRVLQDNFSKRKYQEEKDSVKITFIKRTLDKIDRKVLKAFLIQCIDLIALTEKLRDKYGGKMFILEHITFGLVGFVVVGAGLGLLAGIFFQQQYLRWLQLEVL